MLKLVRIHSRFQTWNIQRVPQYVGSTCNSVDFVSFLSSMQPMSACERLFIYFSFLLCFYGVKNKEIVLEDYMVDMIVGEER